jgi:Zn-dependent peptidase ImmA (M78 family)/DNA-binding XRE family transcriptional regulator
MARSNRTSISWWRGVSELGRFNPRRLDLARRRRALSQTDLADLVGIDRRTLFGYDAGEFLPSDRVLELIASKLDFPLSFFFGEDIDQPTPDTASFRAMTKLRAPVRDAALAQGALALLLGRWIEQRFALPPVSLPDLSREPSPEAAAAALRNMWGWGERPIRNVIHMLESKGVRIFSMDVEAREVDAFSLWHGETPLILLNQYKSAEHARFDACHELAHLVLHRHGSPRSASRIYEREAHEFASAFLMPRGSILANAPRFSTVPGLVVLKRKWGVSVAALAHRLYQVGVLSEWQYRSLYVEISKRGYRTKEPEPMERETSQVLTKVFAMLRADGFGKSAAAQELDLSARELDRLMFGLTIVGLPGGGTKDDMPKRSNNPKLKVIK